MPGSVAVKTWYWGLDAHGPFNELVKECLFVHGWNERTERHAMRQRADPKLSALPYYVLPRMEEEEEEEGVSGVFRYEGMGMGRGRRKKIDEILHLNGRQTGTRSRRHPPVLRLQGPKSTAYVERQR